MKVRTRDDLIKIEKLLTSIVRGLENKPLVYGDAKVIEGCARDAKFMVQEILDSEGAD